MLLLLTIQTWLLTASMIGSSSLPAVRAQLTEVLTATHAGRVLIPQTALTLLLLLTASLRGIAAKSQAIGIYTALTLTATLICVRAASGHAAAQGDFTLPELVQFLHLSSIAIWAGGVMIAGLSVVPQLLRSQAATNPTAHLTHFAHRLSRTSLYAVLLVAITGIYKAWIGLDGSLHPLARSQWGILLTIKSALVILALAIAARNRQILRRNHPLLEPDAALFAQWLKAEAIVMLLILTLSGFLANSPPPSTS
jgi:putative copper resistance protein D